MKKKAKSPGERNLLRELGFDVGNQEEIDSSRDTLIELLRDSGFIVSYSERVAWTVSIPAESNLMFQWWIDWETLQSFSFIQRYISRFHIQRTKP